MYYKIAFLCGVLALVAAEPECDGECTIITKFLMVTEDGSTLNSLPALDYPLKHCNKSEAANCTDDNVCLSFKSTISGDTTIDGNSGRVYVDFDVFACDNKTEKMNDMLCYILTESNKEMLADGLNIPPLKNVNGSCKPVELANHR